MLLEFRTKVNKNGNARYLRIDTELMEYTENVFCPYGIKIKSADLKELKEQLKKCCYINK